MAVSVGFVFRKAFDHVVMRQENSPDSTCAVEEQGPVIEKHCSCLLAVRKDTKVREEVFCSSKVEQESCFWGAGGEQIMSANAGVFLVPFSANISRFWYKKAAKKIEGKGEVVQSSIHIRCVSFPGMTRSLRGLMRAAEHRNSLRGFHLSFESPRSHHGS
jgi:hypothetical protein